MITLTPTAVTEVKRLIEREPTPNRALRVGVKGGGCSGFSYQMGLDEATPKEHDQLFNQEGVTIIVDAKSYPHLNGLTLDFKQDNMMGGGFEFNNPNAKKSCGCGTSFSV